MYKKLEFKRFYKDEGKSGKNTKRPELTEMLEELEAGTTAIVTSISRLSRDIGDTRNIIETIKNKGGTLTILDLNIDTGTAMGDIMMNIATSFSQFERQQTSERISTVLDNMSREGKLITKKNEIWI
jgi:site-specific DNA recombinase